MKHKPSRALRPILIILIGIGLCFGLYYLVDHVWNGSFVNWFEQNYMITTNRYLPEAGQEAIIHEPNWETVKPLFLFILTGSVALGLIIILVVAYIYARVEKRKAVTNISKMLHTYMTEEKGPDEVFPREYAEISAQMSEIKAAMLRGEQALRYEAARKNDLVAYLAHDLKTPLTSVIGYLSLLDEAPDMPVEQKAKYTHIALDKAYRLEGLVNEFFEIARYNLQEIRLQNESIDLYYMLVQMMDEFYPLLSGRGITAALQADENLTVYGDPVKLARVFNNILKNAVSYSDPDTQILISAEKADEAVVVSIQNRGATIPPDKLSAIFEKFYRLDEARSTSTGGSGLGLAIAKEIVKAHGGTINAESKDRITTFTVVLPVQNLN